MTAVFDTNVIVDILAFRKEFYDVSFNSLSLCDGIALRSFITSNTVTDIAYILHRYGQDKESIKDTLSKLFSITDILDVNSEDCKKALKSTISDFEDAVLAECAYRHNADFIVTRNPKDYRYSAIPCIVPLDFIARFKA
ncbi:MAG: PIN domain-containing protein [Treponema sp.]|nr:PIN domain-containing protein [Treponema sp.]